MEVSITIPDQFMGDISGDLSHRRGRILGMEVDRSMQVITAEVPKSELARYASELRSLTGGRGTFEMKFDRYDVVPAGLSQDILENAEQEKITAS